MVSWSLRHACNREVIEERSIRDRDTRSHGLKSIFTAEDIVGQEDFGREPFICSKSISWHLFTGMTGLQHA